MLQQHLAEIMRTTTQSQRRNCACFTPEGVVYLRLKADKAAALTAASEQHHRQQLQLQQQQQQYAQKRSGHHVFGRHRRSAVTRPDDAPLPGEISHLLRLSRAIDWVDERLRFGGRRQRRDTTTAAIDHIGTVIQEIQESLGELETSFVEQQELATSAVDAATSATGARCFIAPAGQVNCSEIVYADEKSWRKSRLQIDQLIQLLKTKIVNLKEMRKHLREHRPAVAVDVDGTGAAEGLGGEPSELEATTTTTTSTTGRSSAHHRKHNGGNGGSASRPTKLERVKPFTAAELNAFGRPAAGNNEVPMLEPEDGLFKYRASLNSSAEELTTTTAAPHSRGHHRQRNNNRRKQPTVAEPPPTASTTTSTTTPTTTTTTTTPVPITTQATAQLQPQSTTQLLAELLASSTASAMPQPPATVAPPHDNTTRFSNELPQLRPVAPGDSLRPVHPFGAVDHERPELQSNQFVPAQPEDCYCEPEIGR